MIIVNFHLYDYYFSTKFLIFHENGDLHETARGFMQMTVIGPIFLANGPKLL